MISCGMSEKAGAKKAGTAGVTFTLTCVDLNGRKLAVAGDGDPGLTGRHNMRSRRMVVATMATAAAVAGLALPAGASAVSHAAVTVPAPNESAVAKAKAKCKAGSICVWDGKNYKGRTSSTSAKTKCVPGTTRSAINNHKTLTIVLYETTDCAGEGFGKLAPGTKTKSFKTPGGKNFASAVKIFRL